MASNRSTDQASDGYETPWFRSIKDFHADTVKLVPHLMNPADDDFGCAWIFSRLFKSPNANNAPNIQPRVRTELHPHRFKKLSEQNLTHLIRQADHMDNLLELDKHLADSAKLKDLIRERCSSLREAFRNPRVAALYALRKEMLQVSAKNTTCRSYSLAAFSRLSSASRCMVGVIPMPSGMPVPFRCFAYDTNGTRQTIDRKVHSGWDIVDSARLGEYASICAARSREMFVSRDNGASKNVVCLCLDAVEKERISDAEVVVHLHKSARPGAKQQHHPKPSSNMSVYGSDLETNLGRGQIIDYSTFLTGHAPEVAIIPLNSHWTMSRLAGISRRTRKRMIVVEVEKNALSKLMASKDSTMLDELTIFQGAEEDSSHN